METSEIFENLMNFENDGGSGKDIGFHKKMAEKEERERLRPSDRLLYDIEKKGFNMSQMSNIIKTQADQLVVSCAGSGKTTSLVFKILYDIKTGFATRLKVLDNGNSIRLVDSCWVGTFLHTGADELKSSLSKWGNSLGMSYVSDQVKFSTLHAEFGRALRQYGFSKTIVDSKVNSNYLKEVVKKYQLVNAKGNALNSEDYSDLESALNYTRNRLDAKRYDKEVYEELGIGAPIIDAILRDWKQRRVDNDFVDHDDIQELIYEECYVRNNQEFINFLANRYNFIYIDEFQDTSQLQYEVLKVYFTGCRQIFVIGDDDQTIYTWRGSDHEIITKRFPEDYNPVINKLSVNYRCPSNILNAIKPSIEKNINRYEKNLESYKEGGVVRILEGSSYSDMAEKLADAVYDDLKAKRSVAILCRVNSDGLLPAIMFDKLDKFTYSISGKNMTLDSYIGTTVIAIVKLFTDRCTPAVKRALNLLAWDTYGINTLMKTCKTNKLSFWDLDEQDLAYSCPSIAERLLNWRACRKNGDINALRYVLADYRVNVFVKDTQFNTVMRSTLMSVETLLNSFEFEDVESFLYELEDINERLKGRIKSKKGVVSIATVHEYKGKEADSVYIWNDSRDVFPIKDSILVESEYEEERRTHYIACTRAKEVSTLVYLKDKKGDFVYEMDLENAENLKGTKTLQGVLLQNAEENANLRRFTQSAEEEAYYDRMAQQEMEGILSPVSEYDENEFWGACGEGEFPFV